MNYKIKSNPNNFFEVIETPTDQVVGVFPLMKEAKDFLRHLNFGGGFDGWTPSFFLKKVEIVAQKA
jgi:hypothetical protein